jgi:hypothetical protein
MKLTTFQSKKTSHKIPQSPFDNDQFIFETKEVNSIEDIYYALTSNFVLNIPLTRGIKTYRRKKSLKDYFVQKLEYLIIDIDHVQSVSDKELCINFFRKNNYSCIIGESRNPLNLKGVLKVNCNIKEAKAIVEEINQKLIEYRNTGKDGDYDYAVAGQGTYQAPTLKHKILYSNLNGISYPTPEVKIQFPVQSELIPVNIQELCKKTFQEQGFQFHERLDNFIKVSHYSEQKSPKGFRWYPENPFTVHHWNTSRNVNIWEDIIKTQEYKDFKKKEKLQDIKNILELQEGNTNERYLSYYSKEVNEFITSSSQEKQILKVQSPMGTAKSNIISEVLKQASENGLRVLFITNRISLADDITNKYQGIKHYLGTELENNDYQEGDSLVVQLDSLYKFSTKFFDLVILDEFSTTLQKMIDLEHHKKKIITQFFSLRKKKIVVLDAIIFDEILELFHPKDKWIEIINSYKDNLDLNIYQNKDLFIKNLIRDAEKHPLTFSCGSNRILDVTKKILDEKGISNIIIRSCTSKEHKKMIYNSFNSSTPKWQVVMYSPTLTVGVSNINNVKIHYHYDSGSSMDVLSSLQMIKRTRNAEVINCYLQERIKYQPTDLYRIQNELSEYQTQDDDGDTIGISDIGVKFSKVKRIFNTLENLHKESFMRLLPFQFTNNIKYITDNELPFVNKMIKIVKKEEINGHLNLFEEYKNMEPEEISEIISKFYTDKNEEQIKLFEFYKDELHNYTENEINILIQEEIKYPGIINCFLKNKELKSVLTKKTYKKELKPCYIKNRNRWYLNNIIKEIQANQATLKDKNDN